MTGFIDACAAQQQGIDDQDADIMAFPHCAACRSTGLSHCSDPKNCGSGLWEKCIAYWKLHKCGPYMKPTEIEDGSANAE